MVTRFAFAMLLSFVAMSGMAAAAGALAPAAQFDFLLGRWSLEVHPKMSGLVAMIHGSPHLVGTWSAARSADGTVIEDELSIVDSSGNPTSLVRSKRAWSSDDAAWKIDSVDVTRARASTAVGHWQNDEMHLDGRGVDAEGKAILTRTRFHAIAADAFELQQDRSSDDGKTWDEAVLTIEAKRTAPATGRPASTK